MNQSVIQSMIGALDKPAIFLTPDYRIQAVNQAYRDTYATQVKLGQSRCHEVSHLNAKPCDHYGEDCPMQRCREQSRSVRAVHIHHTEQGKQHCDILMRPVLDDDGMTLGFLEILENVEFASAQAQRDKMLGVSNRFNQLINMINRSAQSDIGVLLQGETGTGKELVAKAIHDASPRPDSPFVIIECTGLNDSLFESELFGYEKGAFTGATSAKKGLIDLAHGGTVFFDEIGDVPLSMQVKLLRLIETGTYRAVGGLKEKRADFRLVCASHKHLLELVEKGEFRQDLYYRIAGFPIQLPALRERREDIPLLVEHFLASSGFGHKRFAAEAMNIIQQHDFPGNIRELKSLVQQSALLANDDIIFPDDLPFTLNERDSNGPSTTIEPTELASLDEMEGRYLKRLLPQYQGQLDALADILGVSLRTLYRKLNKHGLNRNETPT